MEGSPMVSVITPTYNSLAYVETAIRSVIAQTFSDWELLIVDDCSTDGTLETVQRISQEDSRIRVLRMNVNSGAGPARTVALENAQGRLVAYLDADDVWLPNKLERQVSFMLENRCGFSCASYEVIDDGGRTLDKRIKMLPKVDYVGFLTNNLLQTVGIMVDTELVDKRLLRMPTLKRRQDAATWLQILKSGHINYGMQEVLCQYRRTNSSLSSKKLSAIKGVWHLYRDIEGLPLTFSCYCFVRYALLAVWKRLYLKRTVSAAIKWPQKEA